METNAHPPERTKAHQSCVRVTGAGALPGGMPELLITSFAAVDVPGGLSTYASLLGRAMSGQGWNVGLCAPSSGRGLRRARKVRSALPLLNFQRLHTAAAKGRLNRHAESIRQAPAPDVIHALSVFSVVASRRARPGVPLVFSLLGLGTEEAVASGAAVPGSPYHRWLIALHREAFESTDRVVALDSVRRRYALELGASEESVVELPSAAGDEELFKPSNHRGKAVLFVGHLEPHKGPLDALLAFSYAAERHPDLTLRFAGEGSLEKELHSTASRMGLLGRVESGAVSRGGMPAEYHAARAVLVPSRTTAGVSEAASYAVVEAMLCGVPVAAYRTGGIAQHYADFGPVETVEEGDVEGLGRALLHLLDESDEAAARRGVELRRFALERFGFKSWAERMGKLHQGVMKA